MTEQGLMDLAANSGPIGVMVVALGLLIRGWVAKVDVRLETLTTSVNALAVAKASTDAITTTTLADHERRLTALEQHKAGA